MTMPAADFNSLWRAIDVLEAQEHISLLRAFQFPMLKGHAQKEREKHLYQAAYPRDIYKKEAKDANFLIQKLGGQRGGR